MATLREITEEIISELAKLQNSAGEVPDPNDPFPLPRMIPVGDGRHITSSKKIDQLILTVASRFLENDSNLATRLSQKELQSNVRHGFGAALIQIDFNDVLSANAKHVLTNVRDFVNNRLSSAGFQEYCFGCTLFGNTDIAPFAFGPVRFEVRTDWLERKAVEGAISPVTRRRVLRAWNGQKPAKRKNSRDSMEERELLRTIGSCPFVCSVSTYGFASEAGKERALTAARLALAAIALLWAEPSRPLKGFNLSFDRQLHQRLALGFSSDKFIHAGGSLSQLPHGTTFKPGEWERLLTAHAPQFNVISELLEYVVSPDGNVARPKLMNALTQSLLWFHEACRETVTLMGIVKYAAAMEALAPNRKEQGIRFVLNARLKFADDTKLFVDGMTMKQAVGEIYGYGRSRTMHGTNERLGYDWSVTRGRAEHLARLCLVSCVDRAGEEIPDDPVQFSV